MKTKYVNGGHVFLNPPTSDDLGSLHWKVEAVESADGREWLYGSVTIFDCSKSIHLSIDAENSSEFSDRLEKINKMIDELTRVKESLSEAGQMLLFKI